ncbi:MAG TPA: phosphotransferase family protein [Steroidobacteraceae bacterium]|nr:phosphotransferase family protein [Steroidobacteraceae bacterium]
MALEVADLSDIDTTSIERLAAWLRRTLPQLGAIREVKAFSGGQSNPTYKITCESGAAVLRRRPFGHLLPRAHMIEREYAVMSALDGNGVPVPRTLAFCDDAAVIGSAFYLMEFIEGRIFWNPALPECTPEQRRQVFAAMNATVSQLHRVSPAEVGLAEFGKPQDFLARQLRRWTQQYRASETHRIAAMEALIDWLPRQLPQSRSQARVFHGDLRIDNMIFHPTEPRILAVLDWELSTIGDPLADLAYHMITWRIPPRLFRGLRGLDLDALGIPSEQDYVGAYYDRTGFEPSADWSFYLAFSLFRLAAILQGIAKRTQEGTANAVNAAELGAGAAPLAEIGWSIAQHGHDRS